MHYLIPSELPTKEVTSLLVSEQNVHSTSVYPSKLPYMIPYNIPMVDPILDIPSTPSKSTGVYHYTIGDPSPLPPKQTPE